MASPRLDPVVLTDEERQVLEGWARRRKTAQALALRSRIVLACAAGGTVSDVATGLGSSRATVSKWRSRFLESRLEGLGDEPRPGRPRTVTDEHVEKVITATLEQQPLNGDTHWSTRSMARSAGMSQSAVSADLAGLRPQAPHHPDLEAQHRPAVHRQGPRCRRPVYGPAGERPGAVRRREVPDPGAGPDRSCLPMLPTTPARMTHDYVRNGTTSLFAAFDLVDQLRVPVQRLLFQRRGDDPFLHARPSPCAGLARPRLVAESLQPGFQEPRPPLRNRRPGTPQASSHIADCAPGRAGQHDPGPQRQRLRGLPSPCPSLENLPLLIGQHDRIQPRARHEPESSE